jgi:uncharacterized protein YceK
MDVRALLMLGVACLACGCGTAINLAPTIAAERTDQYMSVSIGPRRAIFGGVALDLAVAGRSLRNLPQHPRAAAVFLPAAVIDLPFSAIGDTLTLPMTIPATLDRGIARRDVPNESRNPFENEPEPLIERVSGSSEAE